MTSGRLEAFTLGPEDRAQFRKHVASLILYLIAVPVAFYRPWASLSINLVVTLIWVVPQLGTNVAIRQSTQDR